MVNYISSNLRKIIKEDEEYHPDCSFSIAVSVDFTDIDWRFNNRHDKFRTDEIGLFECDYDGINGLTEDMNIFQEIKTGMEDSIEENPYNLLFNTNSFVVEVSHKNMWPYEEYFLETIDYKRTGSFQRLERFRVIKALLASINSSGHNLRGLGRLNQESEEEEEEENQIITINTEQTFKEDECVICLTNPPNVLFCNCGHIAICTECDKVKSLNIFPVCKTENTIKRNIYIEY